MCSQLKLISPKTKFFTRVIQKNLNPVWNQSFVFQQVPINSAFRVDVFDKDLTTDDVVWGCLWCPVEVTCGRAVR